MSKEWKDVQRRPMGDLLRPMRKTNGVGVQAEDTRICVVMVGLPARGKSFIAQKGMFGIIGFWLVLQFVFLHLSCFRSHRLTLMVPVCDGGRLCRA